MVYSLCASTLCASTLCASTLCASTLCAHLAVQETISEFKTEKIRTNESQKSQTVEMEKKQQKIEKLKRKLRIADQQTEQIESDSEGKIAQLVQSMDRMQQQLKASNEEFERKTNEYEEHTHR